MEYIFPAVGVSDFYDQRFCRMQSPPVRPARSRAGIGRRLPYGIQWPQVCVFLFGGIHASGDHELSVRHIIFRRLAFPSDRHGRRGRSDRQVDRDIGQGLWLCLFLLANPLDGPSISVRPTDGPGLESSDPAGSGERGMRDGGPTTTLDALDFAARVRSFAVCDTDGYGLAAGSAS